MTTPVNPRLSKLLKEKGFDVKDRTKYQMYGSQVVPQLEPYDDIKWDIYKDYCLAPTIGDVVMWVYEKHGIWIGVDKTFSKEFFYNIVTDNEHDSKESKDLYNSPIEAYEEAIEYFLNKLIQQCTN